MEGLNKFSTFMNNKLEPKLQSHLKNVYACIATSTLLTAAGAFSYCNGNWESDWVMVLSEIGSLVLLILLVASKNSDGKDEGKRFMYLSGFALCTGASIGPFIEAIWDIDPMIVISALLYTSIIFACFSLSALIAPDGQYLALGGPLLAILSSMMLASILQLFYTSYEFDFMLLLLGFAAMCAFILYDIHIIMKRVRLGDRDYISHSLILFFDILSIFRHIMVFLADRDSNNCRRNRNRNNRRETTN